MKNKPFNTPIKVAALLPLLTLAACADLGIKSSSSDNSENLLMQQQPMEAEQAAFINGQWLSVHPDGNMLLTAADGQQQTLDISAEYISERNVDGQPLFISVDASANRLVSYSVRDGKISDIHYGQPLPYPMEGICLYQPSASELNLFVMDENQMAHQLLLSMSGNTLKHSEIRQFPLPPQSEYCVVDDETDQLFVSEENIGVWAYNARAESEVSRKPVDLVQPWGQLQDNAGPLAIANGQLLIGELGSNLLHSYRIESSKYSATFSWQLPQNIAIDSLTASMDGSHIALLDDNSSALYSAQLQLPERAATAQRIAQLSPSAETTPVASAGDAADDPAIWVNKKIPADSLVLGTDKQHGLYVYDLHGNQVQELNAGRVNNVDVRQGFTFKGKTMDIAAASQRDRNSIALFAINPASGLLTAAGEVATDLSDIYGMCMYKNPHGEFFVFVNDKDGRFEQWQLLDAASGWSGKKVREFAVATQPEGCAADDAEQRLFIGEEDVAVWTLAADADASAEMTMVSPVSEILVDDIEGMDVYRKGDKAYLILSSQGNDSYVVYQAEAPYTYIGRFRIGINAEKSIDGASETDGLTVSSADLGDEYPHGMLVVQDGRNMLPDDAQNFKYVDWDDIRQLFNL